MLPTPTPAPVNKSEVMSPSSFLKNLKKNLKLQSKPESLLNAHLTQPKFQYSTKMLKRNIHHGSRNDRSKERLINGSLSGRSIEKINVE